MPLMQLVLVVIVVLLLLLPSFKPIQAVSLIGIDHSVAPNDSRFEDEIGLSHTLRTLVLASNFVMQTFVERPSKVKNYTEVDVIIESFAAEGIREYPVTFAITSGSSIRFNSDYIQTYPGDDVRTEFTGVMYHQVNRVWQWDGNGQAPSGLLTGIADYVRLKAGWPSKYWVKRGSGSRWDEGYAVTAYFLEYCGDIKAWFIQEPNVR